MIKAVLITPHNLTYVRDELRKVFTDGRDLTRLLQTGKYAVIRHHDAVIWQPEVFHRHYKHVAEYWDGSVMNEVRVLTQDEMIHADLCSVIVTAVCDPEHKLELVSNALISDIADKVLEWMKK